MSVLFVFTILFFDIQKILHLIFIQWNQPNDDSTSTLSDDDFEEDFANMPAKKLRWLHNHRKVSHREGDDLVGNFTWKLNSLGNTIINLKTSHFQTLTFTIETHQMVSMTIFSVNSSDFTIIKYSIEEKLSNKWEYRFTKWHK